MPNLPYLYIGEWAIRLMIGLAIILRRRAPAVALAWLVIVAFLPIAGAVAYFLVGENRLGRKRFIQYNTVRQHTALPTHGGWDDKYQSVVQPVLNNPYRTIAALAEGIGAAQPLGGNEVTLISETDQMIRQLISDIDSSSGHCHLLYYVFNADEAGHAVAEALARAAERGVSCRLMVDAVGSRSFLSNRLKRKIQHGGVEVIAVMPANPVRAAVARLDLRTHRKLAVIDGRVAFVGSHNISEQMYPRKARYGAWVDASMRIVGPAVHQLQEIFLTDWRFNTDVLPDDRDLFPSQGICGNGTSTIQVLPTGPNNHGLPLVDVIVQAIRIADRQVVLTTPYFVPDEATLAGLRSAALRGVEVVLVVPKHSDHVIAQAAGRSHYGYLLDVGVQVHEYTKGLLHAKTLTVDQEFSMIGSANLDVRSFLLNFELTTLVYDPNVTAQLHFLQEQYLKDSDPVSLDAWRSRGIKRILGDNIAKLATPLL